MPVIPAELIADRTRLPPPEENARTVAGKRAGIYHSLAFVSPISYLDKRGLQWRPLASFARNKLLDFSASVRDGDVGRAKPDD